MGLLAIRTETINNEGRHSSWTSSCETTKFICKNVEFVRTVASPKPVLDRKYESKTKSATRDKYIPVSLGHLQPVRYYIRDSKDKEHKKQLT